MENEKWLKKQHNLNRMQAKYVNKVKFILRIIYFSGGVKYTKCQTKKDFEANCWVLTWRPFWHVDAAAEVRHWEQK